LRNEYALTPDTIERVDAHLHPLALELAGKPKPETGLEGKLSVHHAVAVALLYGKAGVAEFTDACVRREPVRALRERVVAIPDATLDKAAARLAIVLKDGRTLERYVPAAIGSLEKPMSDGELEDKFRALAAASGCDAEKAIGLVWSLDELENSGTLARAICLT
jgi:2-methylcitrate dehydratase PrpD